MGMACFPMGMSILIWVQIFLLAAGVVECGGVELMA